MAKKRASLDFLVGDSAVFIAAVTALAYAAAVSFEVGYCRYFGIPVYAIAPTTTVVITAVLGLVGLAFTITQVLAMLRLATRSAPSGVRSRIEYTVILVLCSFAAFGLSWGSIAASAYIIFLTCGTYLTALIPTGEKMSDKLTEIDTTTTPLDRENPLQKFAAGLGETGMKVFTFALISLVIAHAAGGLTARTQKEFHVVSAEPTLVVVKNYGEVLVGLRVDEAAKKVTGEVVLMKVDAAKPLQTSPKKIGPLVSTNAPVFMDLDMFR